jgi:hypothetical protein
MAEWSQLWVIWRSIRRMPGREKPSTNMCQDESRLRPALKPIDTTRARLDLTDSRGIPNELRSDSKATTTKEVMHGQVAFG